jgi:hypothetical protein
MNLLEFEFETFLDEFQDACGQIVDVHALENMGHCENVAEGHCTIGLDITYNHGTR